MHNRRIGKCFYAEYIQTTDDCEDFGAICHNGLAGNFLCETCFKRKNCDGTLRLDCCHICEIETISDIDMKCTTEKIDSLSDIDCFIEEYTVNGDCKNINQGNRQFEKKIAETEVQCPALATTVVDRRIIDGQTCVTEKFVNFSGESKITLRYPRWENMPSSCSNAWSFFDCKLREHEREHYRIGMAHCENARIALQELSSSEHCSTDPSLAESAAYNDLQEQINQAKILLERVGIAQQDEFDQETNHGNVTLDCSCEQS